MTKEQWEKFLIELSTKFGSVEMVIDTYRVKFYVEPCKKKAIDYTYAIMTYVESAEDNGQFMFKGKWLDTDCDIRRKFYREKSSSLYRKKEILYFEKTAKRLKKTDPDWYKKTLDNYNKKIVFYSPQWLSAKALKTHLIKNCTSIELIQKEELVL